MHQLKTSRATTVAKTYDDGKTFDRLARAGVEDSRAILCGIFDIPDNGINASNVVKAIQTTAKLFGTDILRDVQSKMVSAAYVGDIITIRLGDSNLTVKLVAEVVPNGSRVWNIVLEGDSKYAHVSYLVGHITKANNQATFRILNMVTRTEKDYIPEPDPKRTVVAKGDVIELRFTSNNDDVPTEIAKDGNVVYKLKEHFTSKYTKYLATGDISALRLDEGLEGLVKNKLLVEQITVLASGEIIDLRDSEYAQGNNLIAERLQGTVAKDVKITFHGDMNVAIRDVYLSDIMAKQEFDAKDLDIASLDEYISEYKAESVTATTEEATEEYKNEHQNSVFLVIPSNDLSKKVYVELIVKEQLPPPPDEVSLEPISGETGLPAEPLKKKEEPDGNEGQESPDLVATAGMKVWFGVTLEDKAVVQMYNNAEGHALLMEFTDSDFEKSVVYRGVVYEVVDNITKDTFKNYKQISELMEHFKLVEHELPPDQPDQPAPEGNAPLGSSAPDSGEGEATSTTQEEQLKDTSMEENNQEEQNDLKDPDNGEEQLGDIGTDPASLPKLEDEHTAGEYLKMLFGTTSPTILHVFKVLTKYGKDSSIYKLTGSLPTIQDVVFTKPAYTFSIVRMKNGCYYKIFVARTDMGRDNYGCWEETHNEPGRWLHLANVSDNRVNEAYRGRQI